MPNVTWAVSVEPSPYDAAKFGWVIRRNGKLYQSSGASFKTREAAEFMAARILVSVARTPMKV